jgi:integrase
MLNNLPKKDKRIFPAKYSSMLTSFTQFKKRLAVKLQKPEILEICFKSFRHWGGTTIAESTDGNVLIVQKVAAA